MLGGEHTKVVKKVVRCVFFSVLWLLSAYCIFRSLQWVKVMDLVTVAEYVENDASKALVRELGVTFAQGHGVGKPQPLAGVLDSIACLIDSSDDEPLPVDAE